MDVNLPQTSYVEMYRNWLSCFGFELVVTDISTSSSELIFSRDITPAFVAEREGSVHTQSVRIACDVATESVTMRTYVIYTKRNDPDSYTWGYDYKGLTSSEMLAFLELMKRVEFEGEVSGIHEEDVL